MPYLGYLDWYLAFKECDRQRACKFALFLCPRRELVVAKILPGAVEIAYKSARAHKHRKRTKKIALTELELLQVGILEAAGQEEKAITPTPTRALICYIKHLVLCTLPRSSFFAAVGFGRILSNGSVRQILDLHSHLDPYSYLGFKEEKEVRDKATILRKQLYERYNGVFQNNGHELAPPVETPKFEKDDIYNILSLMLPWEMECLPPTYDSYCIQQKMRGGENASIELERTRAHVYIDQKQCLELVKSWHPPLRTAFDKWRLPPLDGNSSESDSPPDDDPWRPPDMSHWDEIDERIQKEILWKEYKEKEKQQNMKTNHGQETIFEVVVDGTTVPDVLLNRRKPSSGKISLPTSARYVEIRDRGSRAMVANCHLMDPHDLRKKGWKSTVKLLSGEKVHFAFFPKPGRDAEGIGISMRVKLKASPWPLLAGWLARLWVPNVQGTILYVPSRRGLQGAIDDQPTAASTPFLSILAQRLRSVLTRQRVLSFASAAIVVLALGLLLGGQFLRSPGGLITMTDTIGEVALTTNGRLSVPGLPTLLPEWTTQLKELLTKGMVSQTEEVRVAMEQVQSLEIRGGDGNSQPVPLSPVATTIKSTRPTFHWTPVKGASGYKLIIARRNGDIAWEGDTETPTQLSLPASAPELQRGEIYWWRVKAGGDDEPQRWGKFRVLDEAALAEVNLREQQSRDSALLLGAVYEAYGLYQDAQEQFERLAHFNPTSTLPMRMQDALKQRRGKE